jgi:hypothetical protein
MWATVSAVCKDALLVAASVQQGVGQNREAVKRSDFVNGRSETERVGCPSGLHTMLDRPRRCPVSAALAFPEVMSHTFPSRTSLPDAAATNRPGDRLLLSNLIARQCTDASASAAARLPLLSPPHTYPIGPDAGPVALQGPAFPRP